MISAKDLEEIRLSMSTIKLPKKLKVTTLFWLAIKSDVELDGDIPWHCSLPVEIDDEIDGPYEFVY